MARKPVGWLDLDGLDLSLDGLVGLLDFSLEDLSLSFDLSPIVTATKNARGRVLGKCGATNRKGLPCMARALPGKKRCKFHGGLSTGPKTPEGKQRIAQAQKERWAKSGAEGSKPKSRPSESAIPSRARHGAPPQSIE
jgi:hypothetical protein